MTGGMYRPSRATRHVFAGRCRMPSMGHAAYGSLEDFTVLSMSPIEAQMGPVYQNRNSHGAVFGQKSEKTRNGFPDFGAWGANSMQFEVDFMHTSDTGRFIELRLTPRAPFGRPILPARRLSRRFGSGPVPQTLGPQVEKLVRTHHLPGRLSKASVNLRERISRRLSYANPRH